MGFIFCSKYINTNVDFKQVECDLCNVVPAFHGFSYYNKYEDWESHLKYFFYISLLISDQKYYYAQLMLVKEVSVWYISTYKFRPTWVCLLLYLHSWYALHFIFNCFLKFLRSNSVLRWRIQTLCSLVLLSKF